MAHDPQQHPAINGSGMMQHDQWIQPQPPQQQQSQPLGTDVNNLYNTHGNPLTDTSE